MRTALPRIRIHRLCAGLLACALLAPTALAEDELAKDPTKHPEIVAFFDEYTEHMVKRDLAAAAAMYDVPTMVADIEAMGFVRVPEGKEASAFRQGLTLGMTRGLRNPMTLPDFKTCTLRSVKPGDKEGRVIVYALLDAGTIEASPIHWHLVRTSEGWKLHDFEVLDMGLRIVPTVGILLAEAMGGVPSEWRGVGPSLQHVMGLVMTEQPQEALEAIEPLLERALPDVIQGLLEFLAAVCHISLGEFETALTHLDEVRRMSPGMPMQHLMRATALNGLERFEEALPAVRRYMTLLEPLALARLQAGIALHGLKRKPEALVELRAAADELPEDTDILAYLGLCLPDDASAEFKRRFAKHSDPVVAAREITDYFFWEDATTRMRDLADALEAAVPGHHDVHYIRGEALVLDGKATDAIPELTKAQAIAYRHPEREDPERLQLYVEALIDAYMNKDDAKGAYTAAKDKSFALHAITDDLVPMRAQADAKPAPVAAFAAHVRAAPPTPASTADTLVLEFLDAEVAFRGGAPAALTKVLDPLLDRVDDALAAATDGNDDTLWERLDSLLYSVEDRLIRTQLRAKQIDAARDRAEWIEERDGDSLYVVMFLVREGETKDAITRIREAVEGGEMAETFFEDVDLATLLAATPYAALKAELLDD